MVIQHNISSLNAWRNAKLNNNGVAKNLEKLSSGFRINRAADDAAGLAISEKMRGQIRGTMMGTQNVNMGINLVQTAEGGLNENHAILQRMRELAVQSANGTYSNEDRAQIDKEYQALKSEIDRIAESTHYNGIHLLNVPDEYETTKQIQVTKEVQELVKVADIVQPLYVYTSYVSNSPLTSYRSMLQNSTFTANDSRSNQSYYFSDGTPGNYTSVQFNIERFLLEEDGVDITSDVKSALGITNEWDSDAVNIAVSDYIAADDYKLSITVNGKTSTLTVAPAGSDQDKAESIKAAIKATSFVPTGDGDIKSDIITALGITNEWDNDIVDIAVSDYNTADNYKINITVNGKTSTLIVAPAGSDQDKAESIKAGIEVASYTLSNPNDYEYMSFQNFLKHSLYNADGTIDTDKADYFADRVASALQRGFHEKGYTYLTVAGSITDDGKVAFDVTAPPNAGFYMGGCSAIPTNGFGHYFMHMSCNVGGPPVDTGATATYEDWDWVTKYVTETQTVPVTEKNALWIQSGANSGDGMYIKLCDSRSPALGIDKTAVNPQEKANEAIAFIDNATNIVSSYRADFGASQNRLESIVRNNGVKAENLQAAESTIRDVDMAKEMIEFTKNNILVQAAQSMLAQANQLPQGVLSLLR